MKREKNSQKTTTTKNRYYIYALKIVSFDLPADLCLDTNYYNYSLPTCLFITRRRQCFYFSGAAAVCCEKPKSCFIAINQMLLIRPGVHVCLCARGRLLASLYIYLSTPV